MKSFRTTRRQFSSYQIIQAVAAKTDQNNNNKNKSTHNTEWSRNGYPFSLRHAQ
jgi:hypothetical protein